MAQARILVIAPYPEMTPDLKAIAREYPGASFSIETGDLEGGLESALSVFHLNFDVIISRGGTAQLLEEELSVPVIEIELTAADLLQNLRSVPVDTSAVAVIGFRNVLRGLHEIGDFFPFDVDLYGVDFEDEVPAALDDITSNDYDLVLCDARGYALARERGLEARLLVSGHDGIRNAFERAIDLCAQEQSMAAGNQLLRDILSASGVSFAVFGTDERLAFSNFKEDERFLLSELQQRLSGTAPKRFVVQRDRKMYTIRTSELSDRSGTIFTISSATSPKSNGVIGIDYLDADRIQQAIEQSPLHAIQGERVLEPLAAKGAVQARPIVLTGEVGSGKIQLAQMIYLASEMSDRPLVQIDCSLLDERGWAHLLDNYHSPLFGSDSTLYFCCMQEADDAKWKRLLAFVRDTRLEERCRLMFSGDDLPGGLLSAPITAITRLMNCLTVVAPPLRTWPNLALAPHRYLEHLARERGEAAPAIDRGAAELLRSNGWSGNLNRFVRVMDWLYTVNTDGVITSNDVLSAFGSGARTQSEIDEDESRGTARIDLAQPLDAIEHDVAHTVVERCGGNKSRAAASLGVSRTTLYKMLGDA